MKGSVLLLSALLALASAILQDIVKKSSDIRKVSLASGPLTHANLRQQRDLPSSRKFSDNVCVAGFYNPSLGPYCCYPYAEHEHRARTFEILTNKHNFEFLEWKEGSYGSVLQHSVRTCQGVNKYVGKNKYGLGKVVTQHEAFFLPWEGYEYWYKSYQVLTRLL